MRSRRTPRDAGQTRAFGKQLSSKPLRFRGLDFARFAGSQHQRRKARPQRTDAGGRRCPSRLSAEAGRLGTLLAAQAGRKKTISPQNMRGDRKEANLPEEQREGGYRSSRKSTGRSSYPAP